MLRGGSNLPRVGDYNEVLIVDLIRRQPQISRIELTARTGLTAQAVSNICGRLIEQGLIRESGRVPGEFGKPRTVYEVVPDGRYAIGLHIDPARTVLALVDLNGQVVDRQSLVNPVTDNPGEVIDAMVSHVNALISRNDVPRPKLSGLGVASPGPIGMEAGTVVGAPNLRGWTMVRLRDQLEQRTGLRVELEKDTVAAATGEMWAHNVPSNDFAFVYLGTGSGLGIVLDGEVLHGSSGNLGNFGHLSGDPYGPICYCGGRGCLAVTAMPLNLIERALEANLLGDLNLDDPAAVEAAIAHLCNQAEEGISAAVDIVEGAARGFGRAAANLTNTLDLDTIVFGGPNWASFSRTFMRIVPSMINELHIFRNIHSVTVRGTALGEDVGPIGAASLVLAADVSARSSQLFLQA